MREELLKKITDDMPSYCAAYFHYLPQFPAGETCAGGLGLGYFESIIAKNHLEIAKVKNFSSNFTLPNPVNGGLIRQTLAPLSSAPRVQLDLSEVRSDDFVVEFLAHLRLHNRSEKRHIKSKEICKHTNWKIVASDTGEAVVELDNHNYGNCRNEQVLYKGDKHATYEVIFNDIGLSEFTKTLLAVRINIKKPPPATVSSDHLSLWYLLFGCEVIKNPAALIHHNMAFDLACAEQNPFLLNEYQQPKWVEILAYCPMLQRGAIQQAMGLNGKYSEFMPHRYLYQSESSYPVTWMVGLEANITKQWLELKLGKGVSSYLISKCATDDDAAKAIWDLVTESFDGWGLPGLLGEVGMVADAGPAAS
jgi:hypothetical protein